MNRLSVHTYSSESVLRNRIFIKTLSRVIFLDLTGLKTPLHECNGIVWKRGFSLSDRAAVYQITGGYSWEFLVGGVPPGSPNPDPYFRPKNVNFLTRFHTWQRQKLCHHYLN